MSKFTKKWLPYGVDTILDWTYIDEILKSEYGIIFSGVVNDGSGELFKVTDEKKAMLFILKYG